MSNPIDDINKNRGGIAFTDERDAAIFRKATTRITVVAQPDVPWKMVVDNTLHQFKYLYFGLLVFPATLLAKIKGKTVYLFVRRSGEPFKLVEYK